MLSRLKFDIGCLFEEIYNDRLPDIIFSSDKTTFTDIQSAGLQSILPLINKLREYGHSDENIRSRVFSFSENEVYLNYVIVKFSDLPVTFNLYKEKIDMKFDVVIGNPPYQEFTGAASAKAIWPKFVQKSFDICKEGGYISLIHPNGWRNVNGKFKETQKLLLSKDIKYLEMHDEKDGKKYFNATTSFDWYVINNVNVLNGNTEIMGWDGNSSEQCVNNLEFIPNGMFNEILFLVATEGEETVEILSESSYHTQRNFMSKTQNEGFVYPCVYTTLKDDTINLMWSETNSNGHFGISKLIWSNGMASSLQIDLGGQYGLTQFAYAIVDEPENLHLIKKVMESDIFLKLINNCYLSNGDRFNRKILATFRKDFWRYFLDENNNVIEPNYDVERV